MERTSRRAATGGRRSDRASVTSSATTAALCNPAEWRRAVIPAEHGGWAFLGEPILLGLLVAPSMAGAALAAAAIATFLARQPLRLAAGDRRRGRHYPRTRVAEAALAALLFGGAAAMVAGLALARGPAWLALAPAFALGTVALAFELQRRAREAAAELTAALALAGIAAAIPLAAGTPAATSFGLWAVLAARAVPAILYVRARLRLDREEPAATGAALTAHAFALGAVAALATRGIVPWLAAGAMALLLARAAWGLSSARPRWRTAQIGVSEVLFGVVTVLATAIGVWIGA